jgi:ribonuclease Z
MTTEINELIELAYEGSGQPLTTTPMVGTPNRQYASVLAPGAEQVAAEEIRVTILGSGDPFVKKSQASASVLIEVGNEQCDMFFFDLGSGALANFNGLRLPVTSTTKVFLSHLHADHVGDVPTLLWSLAKSGRRDPVEMWGPAGEYAPLGTRAYAQHIEAAHAWDMESMCGHPGQSGARILTTEVPFDRTTTVYERTGSRSRRSR